MSSDEDDFDIFKEPEDYFPPEKPATYVDYETCEGKKTLHLRLVGHNPLWGHHLWNAGKTIADYLEQNASRLLRGRSVLELGAGAGLPSLVAAMYDATTVVVTDYPDADLIENLEYNIQHCDALSSLSKIVARGYVWGASTEDLHSLLKPGSGGFDVLILADLLFNHSEHGRLLQSIRETLKRSSDARALVFFTPYRPWLLQNDLHFFELATQDGFKVTKVFEKVMDKVMFEEDPGDEMLRRTVYGYEVTWRDLVSMD